MEKPARVAPLHIAQGQRVVCVSDIHGQLDWLARLLKKVRFSGDDLLVLLGDLYTKGPKPRETLRYIMELSQRENVHVLRGNCDWLEDDLEDSEKDWLENLPHIIEAEDYIFVHGGLRPGPLAGQDAMACMKNDAFLEQGLAFDRYVVAGHWPTVNYCHRIPSYNPIVDRERRLIAIDGGTVVKSGAQLNALLIRDGQFSFESVDDLPVLCVKKGQKESGGTINITWNDRFIELVEEGEEFGIYRHVASGTELRLPNAGVWRDDEGCLCASTMATDYHLPVEADDTVHVIREFSDRVFAKKDGIAGWIMIR